ncbi:MAG: hypothetical protein R3C12_00310 [Planctomycetaceae bacterium]
MVEFYYPELLLVGIPMAFAFWRFARWGKATNWIRAGMGCCCCWPWPDRCTIWG